MQCPLQAGVLLFEHNENIHSEWTDGALLVPTCLLFSLRSVRAPATEATACVKCGVSPTASCRASSAIQV